MIYFLYARYRVERFYPSYYSERRPEPNGLLSQLGYGGNYFNVTLSKDDLFGNVSMVATAKVVIIRPGFSTHAMVHAFFLLFFRVQLT